MKPINKDHTDISGNFAELWNEAVQYRNTREQVQETFSNFKNTRLRIQRRTILSVAAAIALIAGGIGLIQLFDRNSITVDSKQLGGPPAYADIDYAEPCDSIIQSPDHNSEYKESQSILFTWKSDYPADSLLILQNEKKIHLLPIPSGSNQICLEGGILEKGVYQWTVSPMNCKRTIVITID